MTVSYRTVGELLDRLSTKLGLVPRAGQFRAQGNSPAAEWRGLYSSEPDPLYRYAFALWWGAETMSSIATWVLLNPATGDTDGKPRPILTSCRHRTERWDCSGMIIVNLFAYRARNPKALTTLDEPSAVGSSNDEVLREITTASRLTIAAWGNGGAGFNRPRSVRPFLRNPQCLEKNGKLLTRQGQPFYPKAIPLGASLRPLP
jgi:hypothetical protein